MTEKIRFLIEIMLKSGMSSRDMEILLEGIQDVMRLALGEKESFELRSLTLFVNDRFALDLRPPKDGTNKKLEERIDELKKKLAKAKEEEDKE